MLSKKETQFINALFIRLKEFIVEYEQNLPGIDKIPWNLAIKKGKNFYSFKIQILVGKYRLEEIVNFSLIEIEKVEIDLHLMITKRLQNIINNFNEKCKEILVNRNVN